MQGGAKLLATAAVLAVTGCGGERPQLQIRPSKAPLSATAKPVPFRIAEARAHLALGNVGLAVESFRKALREQPDSAEAMVGLALSYDQMTRYDLSRRYYENALAIVPSDTGVLTAFARSLELQGKAEEAAAVRGEVRARLAALKPRPAPAVQAPPLKAAQVRTAAIGPSVTVKLPPARPAPPVVAQRPVKPKAPAIAPRPVVQAAAKAPSPVPPPSVPVAPRREAAIAPPLKAPPKALPIPLATPRVTEVAAKPAQPAPPPVMPAPVVRQEIQVAAAPAPAPAPVAPAPIIRQEAKPAPVAAPPPAAPPAPARVAVALKDTKPAAAVAPAAPAPAPIVREQVEVAAAAPLPAPAPPAPVAITRPVETAAATPVEAPAAMPRKPAIERTASASASPRLERLSLGEVALVTSGGPQWRPMVVTQTAQSTTVRFVPLRTAEARPVKIKLLNAARFQGLAARTRRHFAQRGWRQLAIGNARRVRQSSLILYPANRRDLAKRLSAQFGIAIARNATGSEIVVLLGRDAAKRGLVQG